MGQVVVEGDVLPALGEVDDLIWDAVSGGQPVALTRCGRAAAVVIDADSYSEMIRAAEASEGQP